MEDEHAFSWTLNPIIKAAVFDGHAGGAAAKECKKGLLPRLKTMEHGHLKEQFCKFDESLRDRVPTSGTTAVVAMIHLNTRSGVIAHAGDSRALLLHANGSFVCLTTDHKPDAVAEEKRISKSGRYVREGRVDGNLSVSRGFGDFCFKDISLPAEGQAVSVVPEIIDFKFSETDVLFLGCDGFFEVQTNEEVAKQILLGMEKYKKPEDIVMSLIRQSIKSGSSDNHTGVLIGERWPSLSSDKSYDSNNRSWFVPSPLRSVANPNAVKRWRRDAIKGGGSLLELDARLLEFYKDGHHTCSACLRQGRTYTRCRQCWFNAVCELCMEESMGLAMGLAICNSLSGVLNACPACLDAETHEERAVCHWCKAIDMDCGLCRTSETFEKCSSCDRVACGSCATGGRLLRCESTLCLLTPVCESCQSENLIQKCDVCTSANCSLHRGCACRVSGSKKRQRDV